MLVSSTSLSAILGISIQAIGQLAKKGKLRAYRKAGRGKTRFILEEALSDYDKNVNQSKSLREKADKIDKWGKYANPDF